CATEERSREGNAKPTRRGAAAGLPAGGEPMRVAVLGGGNGAHAIAADLALAGHRVRLWRSTAAELEALGRSPTLTLDAEGRSGKATLEAATADIAAALDGAEVVVAALAATSPDELARHLTLHLSERQI